MSHSLDTVLQRLQAEGYLDAGRVEAALAAARSAHEPAEPWYVRALTIIGAWISAGFLLSFLLGLGVLTEEPLVLAALGAVLVAVALGLHRRAGSLYLQQVLFVLSLVGVVCLVGGTGAETQSGETACVVTMLVEGVLLWCYRDAARRFLSVLAVVAALVVLLVMLEVPDALHVVMALLVPGVVALWLGESRLVAAGYGDLARPVAYGLAVSLLGLLVLSVPGDTVGVHAWWIATLVLLGGLLFLEGQELRRLGASLTEPVARVLAGGAVVLALLTAPAPGVTGALLMLALGFRRGNRTLMGLAVVALAGFLFFYYYDLDLTLLQKSVVLAGSGGLLLGLRLVLMRIWADEPAPSRVQRPRFLDPGSPPRS